MGAPAPSAQDFFGATSRGPAAPLPTPEQFFASSDPQSGAAHDTIWSSIESAGARILNHVGYGFQDNWGSRPIGLDSDTEGALRKAGVINDYQQGHDTFVKSINEALIRPAADFADLAARTPAAILGAISGGATQAGEEIAGTKAEPIRGALALPFRAAGEAAEEVAGGALGEAPALAEAGRVPEVAASERASEAARARSAGVVGEGEAGFYGAEPLSPENASARADAAKDAGITPPPPLPPPPDIHALARRIDPETFEQFDALALERDQHRQTLAELGAERETSGKAIAARAEIDEIIGGGSAAEREARIDAMRASAPEAVVRRLDAAQARLEAALTTETPEMIEVRNRLMDADFKMRDLAPEVSAAYRSAQEIAPNVPEVAEVAKPKGEEAGAEEPAKEPEPEGAPPIATGAAVEAEGAPQPVPAVAAGEAGAEAEVAPGSVTGREKLGAGTQVAEGAEKPPTARYGNLRATEGTGEVQTRGLSEGVEAKAIEDGLTSTFGDLPEYRQLSMADQAAKARELIDGDYETAKAVALGDRQPPKGLLPESVFVGVEKRALSEGDVDTLRQLATRSRLTTAATTMGQRIRTLGERDPSSPVGAILEVRKAREADLAKRMDIAAATRDTVAEIKAEMHGAASKADAWRDFLAGLRCESE